MSYESSEIADAIRLQANATKELARATDRQTKAIERKAKAHERVAEQHRAANLLAFVRFRWEGEDGESLTITLDRALEILRLVSPLIGNRVDEGESSE